MSECKSYKYYKLQKQESTDGGITWTPLEVYKQGDYFGYSDECPHNGTAWTVVDGEYVCEGTSKYVKLKKQTTDDCGETYIDVVPLETMKGDLIENWSLDCGYIPLERWDTIENEYLCADDYKWTKEKLMLSYDGGSTYVESNPLVTRLGEVVERWSTECGYDSTHDYSSDYLTTVALDDETITVNSYSIRPTAGVYYSLDSGNTWINYMTVDGAVPPTVSRGDKVLWKGYPETLPQGIFGTFASDGRFDIEGNSLSLLYLDNFVNETTYPTRATTNGNNTAYYTLHYLFSGCDAVCAKKMILPIGSPSYEGMFSGCTQLITAPDLLSEGIDEDGYAAYNYKYMFDGCSNLNYIKCMVLNMPEPFQSGSYNWVNGVSQSGTFVRNYFGLYDNTYGTNTIPNGWTVEKTAAPTTYQEMLHVVYNNGYEGSYECKDWFDGDIYTNFFGVDKTKLNSVSFGNCVTSIRTVNSNVSQGAFVGCSLLNTVTIADSITSIGYAAFSGCTSLTTLTVNAITPPTLSSNAFNGTPNNMIIYVPSQSVNTYKTATNWSTYASRIQPIS